MICIDEIIEMRNQFEQRTPIKHEQWLKFLDFVIEFANLLNKHNDKDEKKQTSENVDSNNYFIPDGFVPVPDYQKQHELCKRLSFGKGRLISIICTDPKHFEGTFFTIESNNGGGRNRNKWYVHSLKFEDRLIKYNFKNFAERKIVKDYVKEKRNQNG